MRFYLAGQQPLHPARSRYARFPTGGQVRIINRRCPCFIIRNVGAVHNPRRKAAGRKVETAGRLALGRAAYDFGWAAAGVAGLSTTAKRKPERDGNGKTKVLHGDLHRFILQHVV